MADRDASTQHTDQAGPTVTGGWRSAAAVVVILALVLGAVGALAGVRRSQTHHAEAVVLVAPLEGNPFSPTGQGDDLLNLESEAQVAASDDVATAVSRREGGETSAEDLLEGLEVTVPVNTQILRIGYDADTAEVAAARAQAFAVEYLGYRRQRAENLAEARRARTENEIAEQDTRLDAVSARLDAATSDSERSILSGQVSAISDQVTELQAQLAESSVGSLDPGQVVTPASVEAARGSGALPMLGGVVGAILGALIGVALMMARRRTTRRLRRPEDLTAAGLPVVAEIGAPDLDEGPGSVGVRALRSAVLGRVDGDSLTVLVAPSSAPGGSRTAVGLAEASAASAVTTILVQAGPASTYADSERSEGAGLVDVLRGEAALHDVLVAQGDHLDVLPAGAGAADLDDLVVSPAMRRVLRECTKRAELVVIASGAPGTLAGRALVDMAQALLVEVPAGRMSIDQAAAIADLAAERGLAWTGAVWLSGRGLRADQG